MSKKIKHSYLLGNKINIPSILTGMEKNNQNLKQELGKQDAYIPNHIHDEEVEICKFDYFCNILCH